MNQYHLLRSGSQIAVRRLFGRVVVALIVTTLLLSAPLGAAPAIAQDGNPMLPKGPASSLATSFADGSRSPLAADWTRVALAGRVIYWIAESPNDPNLLYAAVSGVGVYTSNDGGQGWSAMPGAGLTNLNVLTVAVCPSGEVFAGTWGGGVYRFAGAGWVQSNNGLGRLFIASVVCDDAGVLLAGTYDQGVYRSVNNGGVWTAASNGLGDLRMLVLIVTDSGSVLAGTRDGAFRTTSGGSGWSYAGLDNQAVYDFAYDPNNPAALWAATSSGVFGSVNSGATWGRLGSATGVIYTVSLDGNGELHAGAQGAGAFIWQGSQWVADTLSGNVYCMRDVGPGMGSLVAGTGDGIWARETEPFTPTPTATATATATATSTPTPGLQLMLASSKQGPVQPDDEIQYTVYYEPVGDAVLSSVVVSNSVPANTEMIAGSIQPPDPIGSLVGRAVIWNLGDVAPTEGTGTLSYAVRVVTPIPTSTPTATLTLTATLTITPTLGLPVTGTPEAPSLPDLRGWAADPRALQPAMPQQAYVGVINEGAQASWYYQATPYSTWSNWVIQGPLSYLPMIVHNAGLASP